MDCKRYAVQMLRQARSMDGVSECIPIVKAEKSEIVVVHNTMRDGDNIFECPKPEWRIVLRKNERRVHEGQVSFRRSGMVSRCEFILRC